MDMRQLQDLSQRWIVRCLGVECYHDQHERFRAFFEEAIELSQLKLTREEAIAMVNHVYDRPTGEIEQEVGGVMTCIGVLCASMGISLDEAAATELDRISKPETIEKIRAKQSEKLRLQPKNWLSRIWNDNATA